MSTDNFWNDEMVAECYREIRRRFDNPNDYEGTWEGISKEILKFKSSHTSKGRGEGWEIVGYKSHYAGKDDVIFNKSPTGYFEAGLGFPQYKCAICDEHLLKENKATIHSVKRLSDNSIWTVGERFFNDFAGAYTEHTIDRFEIENGQLKCRTDKNDKSFYQINHLSKLPPTRVALFKDYFGNDVFEGDEIWVLYNLSDSNMKPSRTMARKELMPLQSYQLVFIDEEKAKEFQLINVKHLSVMDVESICEWYSGDKEKKWFKFPVKKLLEISKSKLKL